MLLRGDTDFSQTQHLDRWHAAGDVRFVFGLDKTVGKCIDADDLPNSAWKLLKRSPRYTSVLSFERKVLATPALLRLQLAGTVRPTTRRANRTCFNKPFRRHAQPRQENDHMPQPQHAPPKPPRYFPALNFPGATRD